MILKVEINVNIPVICVCTCHNHNNIFTLTQTNLASCIHAACMRVPAQLGMMSMTCSVKEAIMDGVLKHVACIVIIYYQ